MKFRFLAAAWLGAAGLLFAPLVSHAADAQAAPRVLRIASANDPQTMDPHALALLYQTRVVQQIYEGLVNRDEQFRIEPSLALSWSALDDRTWRFKLRPGVKFHDGSAFTADDAVFSIERALKPNSQRQQQMRGILGARKVDPLTIEVLLDSPDALLPERLWLVAMMSKAWCEKNGVTKPQDYNARQETFAARHAMGTGPFMLERYEADVRTMLAAFPQWWGRTAAQRGNVERAEFLVIQSDATRLAAFNSGQVDLVLDPPFQDVARLREDGAMHLFETGDIGTQFLAFDQHSTELPGSGIKGRNPFTDRRVRRAVYQALDMDLIVRQVLRGQATATGSPLSGLMDGYRPEFERRPPYDPVAARALLKQAGYPAGFSVAFDCLNVSFRAAVCQAMTAMLEKVGIRARLQTAPSALFFPKLTQATASLAEFGWSPPPDPLQVLQPLLRSRDGSTSGVFNAGRYSNPRLDALIDSIRTEPDLAHRHELVADAVHLLAEELPILPLYRVKQIWVARSRVELVQWPNSILDLRWARIN